MMLHCMCKYEAQSLRYGDCRNSRGERPGRLRSFLFLTIHFVRSMSWIGGAYILGFACILGMLTFLIVTAANQATNLVHALPSYANQLQQQEPHLVQILRPFGVTHAKIHTVQQQVVGHLQDVGTAVAKDSLDIVTTTLGAIIDIILVLILSVYLSANGTRISQRLRRETPSGQRRHMVLLITTVNQVVGGYIRGQLTLALLIGTLVGVGMYILHVPYAVLLGILAFFMEFIPVIGVLISGAVCIVLALFQGWITAVLVLAYFVFVHIIEGDVVGPRIIGRAVGIHPATALIALVAGTELFGIWGALLGAPIAGLVQAIATAAWREFRTGDPGTTAQIVVEQVKRQTETGAKPVPQHEVGHHV
jgi:predicted PurR-regulated permease PerM